MITRSPFRYFKTSPEIIRLAVMMYVRFPLSLRNVEDLLHERGIDVCHETVRYWWHRFGPMFAAEIRKRRIRGLKSSRWRWHLDEIFVKINGERHYLWRAVDHEGEVLESFVTKTRDKKAALKFLKKAMRKHGQPQVTVTDKFRSYGAALKEIGGSDRQQTGRWVNNRAENSHLAFRRRERAMLRFRRMRSLQKFAAVHASVSNLFNQERSLSSRPLFKANRAAALAEWRGLCAAQAAAPLSKLRLVRISLPAPDREMIAYCTTKHAVIAMVRQIAVDYARFGVRCNALCPGFVDTPFNAGFETQMGGRKALEDYVSENIPMGRWGTPNEIADSIVYLASDRSSFMTGHALVLDGAESL